MPSLSESLRCHWFYWMLPLWAVAAIGFRASYPWHDQPRFGEAATLFDWCVFVPLLHAICYRRVPPRALLLRTLAIACSGMWIAGRIVPDSAESILGQWGWLRGIASAALVLAELGVMVAVVRIAFTADPDPRALARQGIPPALVKLMLAEARFWRWVWSRLRRR